MLHILIYNVSLLSCPRTRQLCRIKALHPPGHPVTAAVPIKGTLRVIECDATTIFFFVFGATAPPPLTHDDVPQSVGFIWTSDHST